MFYPRLYLFLLLIEFPQGITQLDVWLNQERCAESLHDLENSLQRNPYNLESIDDGFFPPNTHPSLWVEVNYYYNTTTTYHGPIIVHPAAYEAEGMYTIPDFTFQWVISPVFLYLRPEIMEVFSGAFLSFSFFKTDIVLNPLCSKSLDKAWLLLNKLTVKLPQYSTLDSAHKTNGFTVLITKDQSRIIVGKGENNTVYNDNKTTGGIALIMIVLYCLSIGWMWLVPVFFRKMKLLPFPQGVLQADGQKRFCLFWGFIFTTLVAFLLLFIYDTVVFLGSIGSQNWLILSLLLFPIPSIFLCIVDLYFSIRMALLKGEADIPMHILKTTSQKRCIYCYIRLNVLASVLMTLFLQILSFHIGWILLMLITFPIQVGALFINFIVIYFAVSVFISGLLQSMFACTPSGRVRSQEMMGGSCLLLGISGFLIAYYLTITVAGVGYHDGISAMMPNLSPIIFVGLLTWAMGRFGSKLPGTETEGRLQEVMWQQTTSGIGQYYQKELKDLPA